ncbi:MAG: choice-of-anchor U domain-containing protein [Ilumatobacteraceae bacterium]
MRSGRKGRRQYVTIEAPPAATLHAVRALVVPPAPTAPAGAQFSTGLFAFDVRVGAAGGSADVRIHLPPDAAPDRYFKLHNETWIDVSGQVLFSGNVLTLTLIDGGLGDDDDAANGVIVDPGGPSSPVPDVDPPVITVGSPVDGVDLSLGQAAAASYSCADEASGVLSCTGSVESGAAIDTATPGERPFTVSATDYAGNTTTVESVYDVLAGNVTATVVGGELVTTDPGNVGPSGAAPVQTRLQVPGDVAGQVTVDPQPAGAPPTGFVFFDQGLSIAAPAATSAASPYTATFTIDDAQIGATPATSVQVFRSGAPVATCATGTSAAPDPCVESRSVDAARNPVIVVSTTQFGTWTFGRTSFIATSVSPRSRGQSAPHQVLTVAGDGFVAGTTARFSGSGITVHSTTVTSSTSLTLDVSITGGAAVGTRDLTVTRPGRTTSTCLACFTVNPRPSIATLNPSSLPVGSVRRSVIIRLPCPAGAAHPWG